jgi:single-stranded-DNA-specific exonuclease
MLEPFGEANKTPLFLYKNLRIDSIRALSEGKHLKLTLKDDFLSISAIGFNLGYLAEDYRLLDKVDIVGSLEINDFNNKRFVQINIKDIRKSI